MKSRITVTMLIAAAAGISTLSAAQAPTRADRDAARAHRNAEGREAARGPQLGEGEPIPEARERATPSQRANARLKRKEEGVEAAKENAFGEGDSIPEPAAKVSPADRTAARNARRTEAARANKAGEIKSKGESSY